MSALPSPLRIITSVLRDRSRAEAVLAALKNAGLVCVPERPTKAMIDGAWAPELAENAAGVWEEMVAAALGDYDNNGNSGGSNG